MLFLFLSLVSCILQIIEKESYTKGRTRRRRDSNQFISASEARRSADQIEPRTHLNQSPDTPHSVQASPETPHSEHRHPSYEHQAKHKYTRELNCNRTETPLTRARARERTQDHNSVET